MNRQERRGRAEEISARFWAVIPDGEERSDEYARIRLQARIADRIASRAEGGIGATTQSVTRFLPGELGKQFVFRDITSVANGSKFHTNKDGRIMLRLAEQFARAEALLGREPI